MSGDTNLDSPDRPVEQNVRLALEISHRSYVFEIGKTASARERRELPGTSLQVAVQDAARTGGDSKSLSEDARIKRVYLGA